MTELSPQRQLAEYTYWVPEPFAVPSEVVNVADFLAMEDEADG